MSVLNDEWVSPCLHLPRTPTFSSEINLTSVSLISDSISSFKVSSSLSFTKLSLSCSFVGLRPDSRSKPSTLALPFLIQKPYHWFQWRPNIALSSNKDCKKSCIYQDLLLIVGPVCEPIEKKVPTMGKRNAAIKVERVNPNPVVRIC